MDSAEAYIYAGEASVPAEQVNLATGSIAYLVTDSLGSVRGTLNSGGALTGTTSYDAWGNSQTAGGLTAITPFGFAGGYTDPDGLIYLVNRYYDPATGQFTSLDPEISMTGQPYTYANDNPVNAKDPNGLATLGVCLGAGVNLGLKVTKVLHLTAGGCLARAINTGSDDIGLTRTVAGGYGYGRGWWSVGTYYELSNAKKLQQLNGWFDFMGASAPFGGDIGFSAVYFWGGPIIGFDFGTTFGPAVNFVPHGLSYTWVSQFHCKSRWSPCEAGVDFARGTWDLLVGGASYVLANIPFYLSVAKWVIQNRRR